MTSSSAAQGMVFLLTAVCLLASAGTLSASVAGRDYGGDIDNALLTIAVTEIPAAHHADAYPLDEGDIFAGAASLAVLQRADGLAARDGRRLPACRRAVATRCAVLILHCRSNC